MWLPLVMTSIPASQQLLGEGWGEAHAGGHVLAVGDDEVDLQLSAQVRQGVGNGRPPRLADDVADQQDAQPRRGAAHLA